VPVRLVVARHVQALVAVVRVRRVVVGLQSQVVMLKVPGLLVGVVESIGIVELKPAGIIEVVVVQLF
jgi:hypothetical protein